MSNIFYNGFMGGSAKDLGVITIVVTGEVIDGFNFSDQDVTNEISHEIRGLLYLNRQDSVDTVSTTFDNNGQRLCVELSLIPKDRIESVLDQIQLKSFGTCLWFSSESRKKFMDAFNLKPSRLIIARVVTLPALEGLTDD